MVHFRPHPPPPLRRHHLLSPRDLDNIFGSFFASRWKLIQAGTARDLSTIVEPWYRVRVGRELHGAIFRCIAMNYATGSADTKIKVLCESGFLGFPESFVRL